MLYLHGQQHPERTSLSFLAFNLDPTLMGFDDPFAMEAFSPSKISF
jgi:hypothetical protein